MNNALKSNRSNACCGCDLLTLLQLTWLMTTLFVVLVLVLRRLGGGFTTPIPFLGALLVGCALTAYSYLIRRVFRHQKLFGFTPQQFDAKVTLATGLLLLALIIPGTMSLAVIVMWLPWITFELQWWFVRPEASVPQLVTLSTHVPHEHRQPRTEPGEVLVAELRHVRQAESELVSGMVQVDFAANQQTAAAHVAFCPPLPADPETQAEPANGDVVTVRVTESRSYGARLEVKRPAADTQPASVLIAFEAVVEK